MRTRRDVLQAIGPGAGLAAAAWPLRRAGEVLHGPVDAGCKDSFLIFPGEPVRLGVVPTAPGPFMPNCHKLEHADGGMMRNGRVDAPARADRR